MTAGVPPPLTQTIEPTEPPAPGTPIEDALPYYSGHGLRLVLLEGKSPALNGIGWQSRASDDLSTLLGQYRALGPKARRVTGIGMLQHDCITLDVDHLSVLNPDLREILRGGWLNPSSPNKWHSTWRVKRSIGSSIAGFDAAFPPVGGGKWGQCKGVGSQVRIWGPGDPGTHCEHRLGPIPDLPDVLDACGAEPMFAAGDPLSRAELDNWLDLHTEQLAPSWLERDLERFATDDHGMDKHHRCVRRVWHLAHNVAAGAYSGWTAFNAGLNAYRAMCTSEGDWVETNTRKYVVMWKNGCGKITSDPRQIAEVEEKRAKLLGGAGLASLSWDPENDPADALLLEAIEILMTASGIVKVGPRDISLAEIELMLHAVDADA